MVVMPRRLAVVAIANRVAEEVGCELGQQVCGAHRGGLLISAGRYKGRAGQGRALLGRILLVD
jgi:hypothetical protein